MRTFFAMIALAGCSAPQSPGEFHPTSQEKFFPAGAALELLWSDGEFTEGPALAPDGSIHFSDIGNRILRFDPKTKQTTVFRDPSGRSNGMKFDAKGRLIVCEGGNTGGNRRISITDGGGWRALAETWEGKRFNSPNDLTVGPRGEVYFTDPRYVGNEPREIPFEGVFLIEPDGKVKLATSDVQKPNGIVITPDGKTVYVADTNSDPKGNHQLVAFDVAADGTLTGKRLLHDFGPDRRSIDGMTLDREGNILATAGAKELAGLYVFGRDGRPLAFFPTPGDPTNCCFGGGAESSTLYVTAPAGKKYGLYRIKTGTAGR